jgi:nitroreductase
MGMNDEANKVLDDIIRHRRTVRSFKPDVPKRETIEAVIHAGLWAPYAGLAVAGEKEFRRFFVIQRGNAALSKVAALVQKRAKTSLEEMEKLVVEKPFLKELLRSPWGGFWRVCLRGMHCRFRRPGAANWQAS